MAKEYTRAAAVLAAVVVLGTVFGSHRSLAAERGKVEALATTETNGGCVTGDLLSAANTAANLATMGEKYHLNDEMLSSLRQATLDLRQADDLGEGQEAFEVLAGKVYAAVEALRQMELTEKDATYVEGFWTDFVAAAHRMSYDDYNAHAVSFNEKILGRFPGNVLGGLTGVKELPVFEKLEEPN